jgi:hypothetical protein
MKNIPNLFTLLNLFFGCLAIVFVLQNGIVIHYDFEGSQFVDIPEKIWMASLCIGLAAIIDFLDGFVARLLNATSEMGKQLDSLADVVSFGVAPGMIIYQFLRLSYAQQPDGENRFVRKEVEEREETLLIVGYSDKSFIVTPLGSPIGVGSRQARFTFGGFPNCFKLLSKYVNETCYSVSS